MNEPELPTSGYRHKPHYEIHERGPSLIPGKTSKWCPHCHKEGRKQARTRRYTLNGPLTRDQCDPNLREFGARVSSRDARWNKGIVRWLIAPPDPSTDYPWYERRVYARCPIHGWEEVEELSGVRQFGRIRLPVIWLQANVTHSVNLVVPMDAKRRRRKKV